MGGFGGRMDPKKGVSLVSERPIIRRTSEERLMITWCAARRSAVVALVTSTLGLSFAASSALAQQKPAQTFEPVVGQQGKDVVWVPTSQTLVDKMLDIAKVTPEDFLMDLGSGDGRTVITAAKRGARAMGVEYNPDMVALSQKNAQAAGVTDKATFVKADL